MGIRSSAGLVLAATAAMPFATSLFATSALAAGNGLPRTYDDQRIDSPQPENGGLFSLALNVAGDLDGDDSQDLISPQVANFNTAGTRLRLQRGDRHPDRHDHRA